MARDHDDSTAQIARLVAQLPPADTLYLTQTQAAAELHCSIHTISYRIRRGTLRAETVPWSKCKRIHIADLKNFNPAVKQTYFRFQLLINLNGTWRAVATTEHLSTLIGIIKSIRFALHKEKEKG